MFTESELLNAETKLNELRTAVGTDIALFPIIKYLLTNSNDTTFAELNGQLDQLSAQLHLEENFVVNLLTWYSLLDAEQKSIILFIVTSDTHTQ